MIESVPLAARYVLFAAAATIVNLTAQLLTSLLYHGQLALGVAMIVGTACGLISKYVLDKHWIFHDGASRAVDHASQFSMYSATGIVTTAIFWATEYAFDAMRPDGRFRYLGAVIGLTIGYIIKYRLDRRFTFTQGLAR